MVKQNFLTKMLLLFALIVGSSSAWAADSVIETLDFTDKSVGHSNYTDTWSWGNWSLYGGGNNNKGWAFVRFGGKATKSGTAVTKTCTITSPQITKAVDYITIEHLGINGKKPEDFTVSSIILEASSSSNFSTISSSTTVSDADLSSSTSTKTITITPASPISANSYVRIKINTSTTNTNNMGLDVEKVKLYERGTSASLSSISITTSPTKTTYAVGETFDATGMVVTATYSDNSTSIVTNLCSFTPSGALAISDTKVTVSYTEGEVTKTAECSITVKNAAGLAFNPSSIIVNPGGEESVTFSKETDATVSFEVADETIATYDPTTGKVSGLKEGTTKITATSLENESYAAGVAECTITVTDPTWIDFTVQGYTNAQDVTTVNGLNGSVTFDAGTNTQNSPKWYDSGSAIRIYQNNTITITAKDGYVLTSVEFSVTSGSMAAENFNKTVTKVGSTNEFTLTDPSKDITYTPTATLRLNKVKLNIQPASATINIPDSHYGTYCSEYALDFSETDVEAYTAAYDGTIGKVVLTYISDGIVPANTGVVLYSSTKTGEQDIPTTTTTNTIDVDNEMVGVTAQTVVPWTKGDKYNYILQQGKFKKATGASLRANRAYLSTTYNVNGSVSGAPELDLVFGDETTGIQNIERTINDNQYYTLDGRRVAEPTKGLYIVNGKKVVIK